MSAPRLRASSAAGSCSFALGYAAGARPVAPLPGPQGPGRQRGPLPRLARRPARGGRGQDRGLGRHGHPAPPGPDRGRDRGGGVALVLVGLILVRAVAALGAALSVLSARGAPARSTRQRSITTPEPAVAGDAGRLPADDAELQPEDAARRPRRPPRRGAGTPRRAGRRRRGRTGRSRPPRPRGPGRRVAPATVGERAG